MQTLQRPCERQQDIKQPQGSSMVSALSALTSYLSTTVDLCMKKKTGFAWGGKSSIIPSTLPVALLSKLCNLLLQLLLCCPCCSLLCVQLLLLCIHSLLPSTALLTHSLHSKAWCLFAPLSLSGIHENYTHGWHGWMAWTSPVLILGVVCVMFS